jgi:hypothetical protein
MIFSIILKNLKAKILLVLHKFANRIKEKIYSDPKNSPQNYVLVGPQSFVLGNKF